MSEIREDQWRAELERLAKSLSKKDGEGLTVREWAVRMKMTERRVRELLQEAKSRGQLVRGTREEERLDGRMAPVTVYAISKAKK